jgi:predicted DNA-binding transcriptional regulator AlpA
MPEAIANNEFLTKAELAKLCRCSERTIDRLLEEGDAPPITKLSTRRIIFPATSARKWLANRTIGQHRDSRTVASKRQEPE